jgi:hypothetical protein
VDLAVGEVDLGGGVDGGLVDGDAAAGLDAADGLSISCDEG